MKFLNLKKHELLFLTTVFLLPVNLGKHFITLNSYVGGILVDYLIPTLYLTDILVLSTLVLWLADSGFNDLKSMFSRSQKTSHLLVLLIFAGLLSTIASVQLATSVIALVRWAVYSLLFLYAQNFKQMKLFFLAVFTSTLLLSILCIFQFIGQGSVFDNYLFFGEQPYASSTKGIVLENLNGVATVPSYGTFRHPNVLGGFLSIVTIWAYSFFKMAEKKEKKVLFLVLILGFVALLLSFSQSALMAFMLGFGMHLLVDFWSPKLKMFGLSVVLSILVLGLFLPYWSPSVGLVGTSVERRAALISSTAGLISKNVLYGTGLNTNTVLIEKNMPLSRDLRFIQPVHNVFLLILSEGGLFFAILLFLTITCCLYYSYKKNFLFFVSLLQLLLLGSFDHYLVTHVQTYLLFMLTLAFSLTYNQLDYV